MKRGLAFFDNDYAFENGKSLIKIFGKKGEEYKKEEFFYSPYFYCEKVLEKEKILRINKLIEDAKIIGIEEEEKLLFGKRVELWKIITEKPSDVPKIKSFLKNNLGIRCFEYDITFRKRFLYDKGIAPLDVIVIEGEKIEKIGKKEELMVMAFDIEVINPEGIPNVNRDEIACISFYSKAGNGVITTKGEKEFVIKVKNEKEIIEKFIEILKIYRVDVLVGFNSSAFDVPYITKRAKRIKAKELSLIEGERPKLIKKGLNNGYSIPGIIHFDLYPISRLFSSMGVIGGINRFTLEEVYYTLFKKEKKMVDRLKIWRLWEENIDKLLEYSLEDAKVTYEIARLLLPLAKEISELSKIPLGEAALSTSGQFVENLLMWEATKRNEIIPSKPSFEEIRERERNPIEGAFVKLPNPGIYDNIAVLDFRGLYPSIIISYNIDPSTISKEGENKSPTGIAFKKEPLGLIPKTLKRLVDERKKIKERIKKEENKGEKERLKSRSQALKIISNSFYGYLGYARSRWYNRECAESITALGRKHIKEAWKKAEERGFEVLYIDTDSLFLLLKDKTKEELLEFLEEFNKSLPKEMELELEGFYKRAIFVSKKTEALGAKKKYALLGEDGSIKIRGFELVRRDWSNIAKKVQREVLEIILQKGSKEEAKEVVKKYIRRLRQGEVELKDLAIMTQLNKEIKDYEVISPELSAAIKLKKAGERVRRGMLIEYVISKKGRTISEKATPLQLAKDYDAEYYINNQVIPAVMKILKELGIEEEELKDNKKQGKITEFFK